MPYYHFKALDGVGREHTGHIEADDEKAANDLLQARGLHAPTITPVSEPPPPPPSPLVDDPRPIKDMLPLPHDPAGGWILIFLGTTVSAFGWFSVAASNGDDGPILIGSILTAIGSAVLLAGIIRWATLADRRYEQNDRIIELLEKIAKKNDSDAH